MTEPIDQHPDQGPTDPAPTVPRVDRGPGGRFAKGNREGRGNPLAGRAAKIRAVLLQQLTPARAKEIAKALIEQASQGDMAAIRELFDRTIGRPAQQDVVERIEKLERLIDEESQRDEELKFPPEFPGGQQPADAGRGAVDER